MQLLGITLKTPDLPEIFATGVMGIIIAFITTGLILGGIVTVQNGVPLAAGAIAGSVANAYGVSIKETGWRGAVVTSMFCLVLMTIVRALMY